MATRYVVSVALQRPMTSATPGLLPNPEMLVDLIWAQATPADRLDHVRVRGPDDLDLLLILRAEDAHDAHDRATALTIRAARAPALRGWTFGRCDALAMAEIGLPGSLL